MKTTFRVLLVVTLGFYLAPADVAALTISPTKIEVAADPGQTMIGEIELFNEQNETKTFFTSFENFEPRGETGSPYFVGSGTGLASWLGAQGSIELAPGQRVAVPYSITIPPDATPGGYFAAVFFGSQPPATDNGGEVAIGGKVGSLVLLRVNGAVAESGGLLEFETEPNTFFFAQLPINFSYRFNNTGGDRVVPKGELIVTNLFGAKSATVTANENLASVLPNSVRRIDVLWSNESSETPGDGFFDAVLYQVSNFRIGFYTATIQLSWGESQQTAEKAITFLVFPWQLLITVGLALILVTVALRQYNRMIIAHAKRSQ